MPLKKNGKPSITSMVILFKPGRMLQSKEGEVNYLTNLPIASRPQGKNMGKEREGQVDWLTGHHHHAPKSMMRAPRLHSTPLEPRVASCGH
jgi:hypothetical protein